MPLGKPRFFEQLVYVTHGERNALARFEDEGVAGGDGIGQIPERNHAGKVEGRDGSDDAERLTDHYFVNATGDVFEVVTLHHHGDAAGDFDVLDPAAHFGFGFGEGLAIFLRDDAGDVVNMLFEQHLQLEEWLDAVFGRRVAPLGEGCGGGFYGLIDFSASASGT